MKKVFALLFSLLLVVSLASPASAESQFPLESRNGVVVVETCADFGDGAVVSFGWGTGFFVGKKGENPSYLVTNYHVIDSYIEYGSGELMRITEDGQTFNFRSNIRIFYDSNDYEGAYVVAADATMDVAILRLDRPTDKRQAMFPLSPTEDMVGSTVFAIGYPGLAENQFAAATSSWGIEDSSVTRGTISRLVTTEGTGQRNIQLDCTIRHGNSGGPLVNADGAVLGINTWGIASQDNEQVDYAVNIDEAIRLLNANGVPFDMYTAEAEKSGDLPVAAIGGGAAAVVAILVVVLLLSKKKGASKKAEPVVAAVATGSVRSMSMQHGGRSFPINGQILIGRKAGICAVCYQEGTPGVSSQHCTLAFNPDTRDFVLTDMKSTYGTYLANGQRLNPGVGYHLRSGDSFYLGERSNMLTVEVV